MSWDADALGFALTNSLSWLPVASYYRLGDLQRYLRSGLRRRCPEDGDLVEAELL
jgi:hypothetical protein